MKKIALILVTLLLLSCSNDPRKNDKEDVLDILTTNLKLFQLDLPKEAYACVIDEISDNMDDETWSLYVKLIKDEPVDITQSQGADLAKATMKPFLTFECISMMDWFEVAIDMGIDASLDESDLSWDDLP
tara:strand:- start:1502 stop:1891 length:390 start_codon:yes stop_codon:yes gene_type:complete